MPILRVLRDGDLLLELEFATHCLKLGCQSGDDVRLDLLGGITGSDAGGHLRAVAGGWRFVPRDGGEECSVSMGRPFPVGVESLRAELEAGGPVLSIDELRPDEAKLRTPETAPGSAAARLRLLADLLDASPDEGGTEAVLEEGLDAAFHLLGADRGMGALAEGEGASLRVVAFRGLGKTPARDGLSRRVLDAVLREGRDVFTADAAAEIPTHSIIARGTHSICAVPIRRDDAVAGVLYVDRGPGREAFDEEDLGFLQVLAAVVARRLAATLATRTAEAGRRELARRFETSGEEAGWRSPAMQRLREQARSLIPAIANGTVPVLLTGESGVGKEVLARWLHERAADAPGPFVAVNCAAIPHDLAESELFGIEEGVASGVLKRPGHFQRADGGTLFLDEVGEMDLPVQAKLLRAIESRRFVRVGGREEVPYRARVLSATNRSLKDAVQEGRFREDLYWRLCGVELRIPPLRERREDIEGLAAVFASNFAREMGVDPPRLTREAVAKLVAHAWPGNVRELRQRMGTITAVAQGAVVDSGALPFDLSRRDEPGREHVPEGALASLAELERDHVRRVLDAVGGNRNRAAAILGIHPKTLARKLRA